MADFEIKKQRAENIYQGETLHIGQEDATRASRMIEALLTRIDRERPDTPPASAESAEWSALRGEVRQAGQALPARGEAAESLNRAHRIALGLRAASIAAAIASIAGALTG